MLYLSSQQKSRKPGSPVLLLQSVVPPASCSGVHGWITWAPRGKSTFLYPGVNSSSPVVAARPPAPSRVRAMRHTGRCRAPMRSLVSTLRTKATPPGSLAPMLYDEPQLQTGRISSAGTRLLRTTAGRTCADASAANSSAARSRAALAQALSASSRSYAGSSSSSSSSSSLSPSPLQMPQQQTKRAPVECGVVSPRRTVPDHISKTPYYATGAVPPQDDIVSRFGCVIVVGIPRTMRTVRICSHSES